jgi:uncharacterized membrane protein
MKHRMAAALLGLVGFFISLYLWLWKIGLLGTIACGDGGCEVVQLSEWAYFLGVPVAFWGMLAYGAIVATSLAGLQPRWLNSRGPSVLLAVQAGIGVLFSGYLTYLEAAVIHAWCRWCVVSAILVCVIFAVSLVGLRRRPGPVEAA